MADATTSLALETPGRLLLRIFPPIMLPIFMAVMDQTIVSAALPAIATSVGGVEHVSWIVLSYLVANSVAAPVYGRLGDAFGRRRLMLVALVVFVVASLLCSLANSLIGLTLARVLQGLGGGGLMVLAQALIGENVPQRQRGRYQGYLSAVIVCASTFGPVAGGVLTQHFGWRSVFLVNLPLGLLALALAWRLPSRGSGSYSLRFDWIGLALFTAFVVPLLLVLEGGLRLDGGGLVMAALLLGVSALCFMLLLRQERRARQPLFVRSLLARPAMWRACAMAACSGALLVSEVTFLPIYLHVVNGASAGQIGALMLPLTATVGMGSLITGTLITRTGRTALFPSIGQPLTAVALVVVAFTAHNFGLWGLPAALAVVAIFQGTAMPVAQIVAQIMGAPNLLGAAAAAVQLTRSVGSAVGVALVGAVLFGILAHTSPDMAAQFSVLVERGPEAMVGLSAEARAALQLGVAHAFRGAFLTIALFAAMGAALSWTMPLRRL
jgi:EmrB/QacA subfamily drug resistance transporter